VRVGPTGAAKILFAFWPNALPPWDKKIRTHFGFDGSADSYADFLSNRVLPEIRTLEADAARFQIPLETIPLRIGRPDSTIPKLVDEYYWVTRSQGYDVLTKNDIQQWAIWADVVCNNSTKN